MKLLKIENVGRIHFCFWVIRAQFWRFQKSVFSSRVAHLIRGLAKNCTQGLEKHHPQLPHMPLQVYAVYDFFNFYAKRLFPMRTSDEQNAKKGVF